MKLAILSILLLLQLTSEIMGFAIHSKRRSYLNRRSESLLDKDVDDEDFGALLSSFGSDVSNFATQVNDDQSVVEALDLIAELGQQWINAYKQRKLEPITSTLYKIIRTIIVKTNNEDVKKILKVDESILKMLDELNGEKDVSKLFEQIGQNQELLIQALEVFNAYLEVDDLVQNEEVNKKIEKLLEDAFENERTQELVQSLAEKFIELSSVLTEDTTVSQAKPAILEFSNYIIDTIASGKFEPFLQALYDAAQLVADNVDINDPKVHTFLNEVFKFEKILKESIKSVNGSNQRRNFIVRQLLKLR